jgi:hypothetical protein
MAFEYGVLPECHMNAKLANCGPAPVTAALCLAFRPARIVSHPRGLVTAGLRYSTRASSC